jgi:multidrug resistance efflux pump
VNVEKVDLAASSYRLDFYLWFRFNPSEISLVDVRARIKEAEAPSKEEIEKLKADIEKEKRKKAELQKRLGEMRVKLENVVNTWKNCLIN